MDFIDLKAQYAELKSEIDAGMGRVLARGQFILGPEVPELEEAPKSFTGSKHCIPVANGTDAMQIEQMALGIGPGDEVITPGFTYIATAENVAVLGAKPVYVDVDPVKVAGEVISLPMHPYLAEEDQVRVVSALRSKR